MTPIDQVVPRGAAIAIAGLVAIATCHALGAAPCDDPPGGWTAAARAATYAAVSAACSTDGASADACAALAAVTARESDGRANAIHRRGPREHGVGAHGISARWATRLGLRTADLCDAATSTRAVLAIWRRAAARGARSWVDLQRYFGGRWELRGQPVEHRLDARWCRALAARGVDCHADPRGHLGSPRTPAVQDDPRGYDGATSVAWQGAP